MVEGLLAFIRAEGEGKSTLNRLQLPCHGLLCMITTITQDGDLSIY